MEDEHHSQRFLLSSLPEGASDPGEIRAVSQIIVGLSISVAAAGNVYPDKYDASVAPSNVLTELGKWSGRWIALTDQGKGSESEAAGSIAEDASELCQALYRVGTSFPWPIAVAPFVVSRHIEERVL